MDEEEVKDGAYKFVRAKDGLEDDDDVQMHLSMRRLTDMQELDKVTGKVEGDSLETLSQHVPGTERKKSVSVL